MRNYPDKNYMDIKNKKYAIRYIQVTLSSELSIEILRNFTILTEHFN